VTNPLPPRGLPLAFVADLDTPVLEPDDHHHLARVLRLRVGDPLAVSDGNGAWRRAAFAESPAPDGPIERADSPLPNITLVFALPKGDRPEWIVQKGTELGIDRFVPMHSARSVVRWEGPKSAKQIERLHRISREAAMQSRRPWLPRIDEPTAFVRCLELEGAVVAEPGGDLPTLDRATIIIGPEGGFTDDELALAPATVGLSSLVLRVETAALAAAAIFTALRDQRCNPIR
jgi:16S rRNA (uracil1498-N3)-methyltransferase